MIHQRLRIVLWALVGLAALGGILIVLQRPSASTNEAAMATIGGPFTLTGTDGKPFASSRLNGKPAAIFFGFTNCPDVCPTTLARLVKLRKQLGQGDDALSIVFVTVDPERDGPAEVGSYAGLFNAPVIGLTGSTADIERVKKQFGVFSQKVDQPDGSYSVDHTASVFLMDRNGTFVATLSPEEGDAVALAKIRRLLA
jgi:protein SCO1/2